MGTQQLLLIILGMIVVGVAIVIGIGIFGSNNQLANVDAVIQDCMRIAANAQGYYRKPAMLGGGGTSFSGITLEKCGWMGATNQNGTYALLSITDGSFVISGNGTENASVLVTVYPDSTSFPIITLH